MIVYYFILYNKHKQKIVQCYKKQYKHVVQATIPRKPKESKDIIYEYEYEKTVDNAQEEIVFDEADKYDD